MNLVELCCYRLAERGVISENAARVLAALHRHGPMNGLEVAEVSGVETGDALFALTQLEALDAVRWVGSKYTAGNIWKKMEILADVGEKWPQFNFKVKKELGYVEQIV